MWMKQILNNPLPSWNGLKCYCGEGGQIHKEILSAGFLWKADDAASVVLSLCSWI